MNGASNKILAIKRRPLTETSKNGVASQDRTLRGLSFSKRLFSSELLVAEQYFVSFLNKDGLILFARGLTFLDGLVFETPDLRQPI